MDPQVAHAALGALRCWIDANAVTIEARLGEAEKVNAMLEELFARRVDVSGSGSRSQ
jgi:hypothetical protein